MITGDYNMCALAKLNYIALNIEVTSSALKKPVKDLFSFHQLLYQTHHISYNVSHCFRRKRVHAAWIDGKQKLTSLKNNTTSTQKSSIYWPYRIFTMTVNKADNDVCGASEMEMQLLSAEFDFLCRVITWPIIWHRGLRCARATTQMM